MSSLLTELDHVMLAVHEHAPAIEAWQRMGFTVRPVRQLAPMGGGAAGGDGGSAAVLLRSSTPGCANYIEIARADPVTAAPALKSLLRGAQGVAMLVHATSDPEALARQWSAKGWRSQLIELQLAPMGPGETTRVQIVLPEPGQTRIMFNAMRMSSTADFERNEWRGHPNTARRWSGITYIDTREHVSDTRALLTELYGDGLQQIGQEAWSHRPGRVGLTLMSEEAFHARFGPTAAGCAPSRPRGALLTFEVDDLIAAQCQLELHRMPHADTLDALVIPATEALGVAIELKAAT
jgi:hypothetical protein